MRSILRILIACAALTTAAIYLPTPAPASEQKSQVEAQKLVQQTVQTLMSSVRREKTAIEQNPLRAALIAEEILTPYIDFNRVSRLVLGKHWRTATAAQQERFTKEFRKLGSRTYATALIDYLDAEGSYLPMRPSRRANDVLVRTEVARTGKPPFSIHYRLRGDHGAWKVYDVIVEGVSLISTYRTSFAAEIRKAGVEGLIEALIAKNQELSKGVDP